MISKVIGILSALVEIYRLIVSVWKSSQDKKAEEKSDELDKAVEDAKKAKTPEEAFNAQDRIVDNKP